MKGFENLVYECFHATSFKYKGQVAYEGHRKSALHPIGPIIYCEDAEVILTASDGYEEWPVIFRRRYGKADVIPMCVTDYPALLCEYPEVVRQAIRDLIGEYIGVNVDIPYKLRSYGLTPQLANFVLHIYSDGHVGVANYNCYGIPLELTLNSLPRFTDRPKLLAGNVLIEETVDQRITMRVPARSHGFIKVASAN